MEEEGTVDIRSDDVRIKDRRGWLGRVLRTFGRRGLLTRIRKGIRTTSSSNQGH
jgi:hypothetical protein